MNACDKIFTNLDGAIPSLRSTVYSIWNFLQTFYEI